MASWYHGLAASEPAKPASVCMFATSCGDSSSAGAPSSTRHTATPRVTALAPPISASPTNPQIASHGVRRTAAQLTRDRCALGRSGRIVFERKGDGDPDAFFLGSANAFGNGQEALAGFRAPDAGLPFHAVDAGADRRARPR